jgi:hypothetical protein
MRRVRQLTDRHARPLVPNDEVGGASRPHRSPATACRVEDLPRGEADDAEAATGCCEGGGRRTETERWRGQGAQLTPWRRGRRS